MACVSLPCCRCNVAALAAVDVGHHKSLAQVAALNSELLSLSEVIFSPTSTAPYSVSALAPVDAGCFAVDDGPATDAL